MKGTTTKPLTPRKINAEIKGHIAAAIELAEARVEELARDAMRKHPNLCEFIMGMGSALFVDKEDNHVDPSEREYLKPLNDFLFEWDDVLHLTGISMRFTVNGPKITDW